MGGPLSSMIPLDVSLTILTGCQGHDLWPFPLSAYIETCCPLSIIHVVCVRQARACIQQPPFLMGKHLVRTQGSAPADLQCDLQPRPCRTCLLGSRRAAGRRCCTRCTAQGESPKPLRVVWCPAASSRLVLPHLVSVLAPTCHTASAGCQPRCGVTCWPSHGVDHAGAGRGRWKLEARRRGTRGTSPSGMPPTRATLA